MASHSYTKRRITLTIRMTGIRNSHMSRCTRQPRPPYFPAVVDDGYVMIDGGVWANNPVMNAVVDALACFDVPRENLRVLSLGTGDGTFTVEPTAQNGGIAQWGFSAVLLGRRPRSIQKRTWSSRSSCRQTQCFAN